MPMIAPAAAVKITAMTRIRRKLKWMPGWDRARPPTPMWKPSPPLIASKKAEPYQPMTNAPMA